MGRWAYLGIARHSGCSPGGAPWWSTSIPLCCQPSPPGASLAHLFFAFLCGPHAYCQRWTSSCLTGIKGCLLCFSPHRCSLKVNISCLCSDLFWQVDPIQVESERPVWGLIYESSMLGPLLTPSPKQQIFNRKKRNDADPQIL